jgi:hypothetical protein
VLKHIQSWTSESADDIRDPLVRDPEVVVLRVDSCVLMFVDSLTHRNVRLGSEQEASRYFDITVDGFKRYFDFALQEICHDFNYERMRGR